MKWLSIVLTLITATATSQPDLTADQWRADLKFLQETVHEDYPFLFKKTTAHAFDSAVAVLHQAIPKLAPHEIIVGLARTVALFEYGHTTLPLSGWRDRGSYSFDQARFVLDHFSDGIFVQGTTSAHENTLGAKVIAVEGMPIDQALAAVKPAFPTENDAFFMAYGLSFLGCPQILHAQGVTSSLKKSVTLTLEKEGKVFDHTFDLITEKGFPGQYTIVKEEGDWLNARDNSRDPLWLKHLDRIYYFEHLPEHNAVYVRQSQIQDDPEEDIPTFYERVFRFIEENQVDKLILDVRLNGGGNNYKNKPVITGVIRSRINEPGKFFVITGGQTFSACQNLVNELSNYTNAIFVGGPTGENINFYGDNNEVTLPNSKINAYLSFAWWQDKPQWENADWLAPHLAVEMSFEEYATNQDPLVAAALNFSSNNFVLNPMQYLTDLYQSGQHEKLQSEAVRMINDPAYAFFDFEKEFNDLGYELMGRGDVQTAVVVFQFAAGLFPDSANVWDSLAEGMWRSGNIAKAKELYQKAISMDPDGYVGENARKMLKRIKEESSQGSRSNH